MLRYRQRSQSVRAAVGRSRGARDVLVALGNKWAVQVVRSRGSIYRLRVLVNLVRRNRTFVEMGEQKLRPSLRPTWLALSLREQGFT